MATITPSTPIQPRAGISIEEYLEAFYEPECEYIDGELIQKAMGTKDHAWLQATLVGLLFQYQKAGLCQVLTEQSLRVRQNAVLIPDVCLLSFENSEHGIVAEPPLLCIEVLSPSDRFTYTVKKCQEYLNWGVRASWIFDPEEHRAWFSDASGLHPVPAAGVLRVGDIELALAELWP